jgi:ABC-type antimicrobial peptide transport system permease subunit
MRFHDLMRVHWDTLRQDVGYSLRVLRRARGFAATSILIVALEIGVRMALGARPADILAMVVRRVALLVAAGLIVGVGLAYVAGRWMEALLAGVKPADTATLASVVALSLAMAILGSVPPARRAVRIDPVEALRRE